MAARRPPPPPERQRLSPAQMRVIIGRLQTCIRDLNAFDPRQVQDRFSSPEVTAIQTAIDRTLVAAFGSGTVDFDRYASATRLDHGPVSISMGPSSGRGHAHQEPFQQYLQEGKDQAIILLTEAVKQLEEELEDADNSASTGTPAASATVSRRVFIVHGRDNEAKIEVARFLNKIGLEEIILHERPNAGRHLLTKFQEEAHGASFAVVLITPDDDGGIVGGPQRKRARQNVIFELGFFIGKLGPSHVAALVKGDVETPSDFDGIGYIGLDTAGGWKGLLARELNQAKVPFDHAKVFEA